MRLLRCRFRHFCLLIFDFCFLISTCASAHVGSPDVYLEGNAGPYEMTVVVRPPAIVPGIAEVEVYLRGSLAPGEILALRIQPVTYATQKLGAPVPDVLTKSTDDPRYFTGHIWFMDRGSYSVRVIAAGSRGDGTLIVPVPSTSTTIKTMPKGLGWILAGLLVFLLVGAVSVCAAAVREGELTPGVEPDPKRVRRSRITAVAVFVILVAIAYFGNAWWVSTAAFSAKGIYKPLEMKTTVDKGHLTLDLSLSGWALSSLNDLAPDHGHIMHLFLLRMPDFDAFYHLHPAITGPATYEQALPPMPAGTYRVFADIVHESGFPETPTAEVTIPEMPGTPMTGDDSAAARLLDGLHMVWDRPASLVARKAVSLDFRLVDAAGQPASGMELYMGMQGHAVVARRDLAVFAHLHPMGTVPMAALMAFGAPHSMNPAIASAVSFPYGFPQPGSYRIWVQMKHKGVVLTVPFDCEVK
jgi:hypothetical protein